MKAPLCPRCETHHWSTQRCPADGVKVKKVGNTGIPKNVIGDPRREGAAERIEDCPQTPAEGGTGRKSPDDIGRASEEKACLTAAPTSTSGGPTTEKAGDARPGSVSLDSGPNRHASSGASRGGDIADDAPSTNPTGNAARVKAWRERLKSDPEKWAAYLKSESERKAALKDKRDDQ